MKLVISFSVAVLDNDKVAARISECRDGIIATVTDEGFDQVEITGPNSFTASLVIPNEDLKEEFRQDPVKPPVQMDLFGLEAEGNTSDL